MFGGAALAALAAGCSLIVGSDVPEFTCASASASACPSGLTCDLTTKKCVAPTDGAIPSETGGDDAGEDAGDGSAVDADAGPLDLGSACRVNDDCKSKLCGTSTILTTAITTASGPICTTPCCTSAECSPTFVCINGGTGGGYCVPAALAQRQPPASGGKGPGATCATNQECRSGLCDKPDAGTARCLDTCCAESTCTGGTTCRLKIVAMPTTASLHEVWVCAEARTTGVKAPGDACGDFGESCRSDLCLPVGGGLCRPSCSSTAACRTISGFTGTGRCVYGNNGSEYFKYCQQNAGGATVAKGQPCTTPGECVTGHCDAETKKCEEVCARDSDCLPSESCKPAAVNTPFLRCVPK